MTIHRVFFVALLIAALSGAAFATTDYYVEPFENFDFCNTNKTTADWNINDSIGAPGRIVATEVGYTDAGGYTVDLVTNGKYIFCASVNDGGSANGGLYVLNSETFGLVASYVTDDNEQGVAIDGRYAYLVDDAGEIEQIDCGDLSGALSSTPNSDLAPTELRAIVATGGYLYIAASTGLIAKAGLTGGNTTFAISDARDIAEYGPYLLVVDNDSLQIFSLLDPSAPNLVAEVEPLTDCRGVSISGFHALVAAGDSLYIINIEDPTAPTVVNRLGTAGDCYSASEQSGKIYAACGAVGTMVYLADDFTEVRAVGVAQNHGTGEATSTVAVSHQVAVADSSDGGIQFLSQGEELEPATTWDGAAVSVTHNPVDMIVIGDYAYVSVQILGLVTIDLKTNTVTDTDPASQALGLCQSGGLLLQAIGLDGIRCYTLADPSKPAEIWTEVTGFGGATVWDADVSGNFAYVATGTLPYGIYKIPILGASHSPVATQTFDTPVYTLDINGDVIYTAATDSGVISMDLNFTQLDTFQHTSGSCWQIIAENDYAYVNYFDGGIVTLDISDPENMTLADNIGSGSTGYVLSIERFDNYLLIGRDETDAMLAVDVSDPTALGAPSTSLEGTDIPSPLVIPGAMKKYRDRMVLIDYVDGLRNWITYPNDCTDSLVHFSVLHSEKVNGGAELWRDEIRFVNWKAKEYFPTSSTDCDSTDRLDTLTYYIIHSRPTHEDTIPIWYAPLPGWNTYVDPPPPPWATESWYWLDAFGRPGYPDIYWYGEIREWHDVWAYPDSTVYGGPPPDSVRYSGVWHVDTVWVGYRDWFVSGRRSLGLHVDFGAGVETDLVITLDSAATDRFDPGLDIPFVPSGLGPHAYWALDDPDGPFGVGLSACYVGTGAGARPVRLILTAPATLSWTIPPDLEPGNLIIDGVDMFDTTTVDLSEGEHILLPNGGFATFFQSSTEHGWNMLSPYAIPLCDKPSDIFGVNDIYIWSYDETLGGYYNPDETGEGRGYFVLATSPTIKSYCGIYSSWTRTEIHTGWNLIGGPSAGPVHVSALTTDPDSALWVSPLYTLESGGYIASEWLEPGKAYWAFALNDAILYADYGDGSRCKPLDLREPETEIDILLVTANVKNKLTIGIDPHAEVGADMRFDRLLVPPIPGSRNLGYLVADNAPGYLSSDIRPEKGEWKLVINETCRITGSAPLAADNGETVYRIYTDGVTVPPGIYKLTLDVAKVPKLLSLETKPNPFNTRTLIKASIPACGNVTLSVFDITGRRVAGLYEGKLSAGAHSFLWTGTDDIGRALPTGIYFLRLSLEDGPTTVHKTILIK